MKKAFTLVEMIAALAIFSITMIGITNAFSSSIHTWSGGAKKLNNGTYSKAIIEILRSRQGYTVDTLYNNYENPSATNDQVTKEIYFDNSEGIKSAILSLADKTTLSTSGKFKGTMTIAPVVSTSDPFVSNYTKHKIYRVGVNVSINGNNENEVTIYYDFPISK